MSSVNIKMLNESLNYKFDLANYVTCSSSSIPVSYRVIES